MGCGCPTMERGLLPSTKNGRPVRQTVLVVNSRYTSSTLLAMSFRCRRYVGADMGEWSFLTNHARAMLFIAHVPGARLRDLAAALGVTERTAYGIVTDLSD